jgi:YVTN family beta-propeller protein
MSNNFIPNQDACLPCQNQVKPASNLQIQTQTVYTEGACSKDFIDSALLKYKFGLSYCEGHGTQRWIPSWLLNSAIVDHAPEDLGFPDPCSPNLYYKIIGGNVYGVSYSKDKFGRMKEIERIYLKSARFQDNLIESIDAKKIVNRCNFFKNTTLVQPMADYQTQGQNDVNPVINPNYKMLDVAITDDCKLKAMWQPKMALDAVLPALSGLIKFDPITGTYTDLITPKVNALQAQVNLIIANGTGTGGNNGGGGTGGNTTPPATPTQPASPALAVGYAQGAASNPPGLANGSTIYSCGVPQLTWGVATNAVSYEIREGTTVITSGVAGTSYTLPSVPTIGTHTYSVYGRSSSGIYSTTPFSIGPINVATCGTNNGGGGTGNTGVTGKMYITNAASNDVTVIDLSTNAVQATIPVGTFPKLQPILNLSKTKLFVLNSGSNSVSVIDTNTNSVTATIPVGNGSTAEMVMNETGTRLYVLSTTEQNIYIIDTATNTVKESKSINLSNNTSTTSTVNYLHVNGETNKLYAAQSSGSTGFVFNILVGNLNSELGFGGTLPFFQRPVTNSAGDIMNSVNSTVVNSFSLPIGNNNTSGPASFTGGIQSDLVIDPNGAYVYFTQGTNQLTRLPSRNTNTFESLTALASMNGKVVFGNNNKLFVASSSTDQIATLFSNSNNASLTGVIAVGDNPLTPTIDNATNRLYVTNKGSNSVSVINTSNNTVIATIPVGLQPSSSPVIA